MPRLSKIGAAALAAFGWTSGVSTVSASYLVVAGGGAGGNGGGGAGGYRTGTASLDPTLSYTITVGAGGANATYPTVGSSGGASSISSIGISSAGGGAAAQAGNAGLSGGSGGGGAGSSFGSGAAGSGNTPSTSPSQGNNGGTAGTGTTGSSGGGGASAVGGNGSGGTGGAGGAGTASSISGSSVTYSGGGGAGGDTAGAGGSGGGGAGASGNNNGTSGTSNTGGGGGGTRNNTIVATAGNGGSGVVIISYAGAQQFSGGVVTSVGGNTIHTFNTSGTLGPITPLSANYLVVAGGGGGGAGHAGGGGAGGLLTGSGVTIDPSSTYLVTVGSGGAGAINNTTVMSNGTNSVFSSFTAIGGGFGGGNNSPSTANINGNSGGSGGGGANSVIGTGTGGAGTSGQGNAGGSGSGGTNWAGGGGGGASAAGANNPTVQTGGAGGAGTTVSAALGGGTYAGGGGGGGGSTAGGAGGAGGGGAGTIQGGGAGVAGTANTGGGGGGARNDNGGNGGSGIVIISYAGATQQMAGGTVTITGGNVIHTFTSSGYLTPIKYVGNSLRFRSSASAYLSRTAATPTNANIWTWSGWVKRGTLTTRNTVLCGGSTNVNYICFGDSASTDNFGLTYANAPSQLVNVQSTAVYRDPAAWYHFVVVYDSTSATSTITGSSTDRVRLYVNGVQITSFTATTPPSQNTSVNINAASAVLNIGRRNVASPDSYLDGYLAEVNFIDGQALTPNSFGTRNSYGVWQPITYGGSYGTNGFYLPFTNTTSTTTLGYDFSPNGNNWTTNNISLTAGTTYDSMTDVPTLTSATAANYCTLNPLQSAVAPSDGNLKITGATAHRNSLGTINLPSTSKFYFEGFAPAIQRFAFGLAQRTMDLTVDAGSSSVFSGIYGDSSLTRCWNNGTSLFTFSAIAANDVFQIAVDCATGKVWLGRNNTFYSSAGATTGDPVAGTNATFTLANITDYTSVLGVYDNASNSYINFGQRPFSYTPPSGYVALNTYNL